MPKELLIKKPENDIDGAINRFSNSLDELTVKLERPIKKTQDWKENLHRVQKFPWGLVGIVSAFGVGFWIMRNKKIKL